MTIRDIPGRCALSAAGGAAGGAP